MAHPSPIFGRIPVVGRPVVVHEFHPVVLASCGCGRGRPFLIGGLLASGRCDACGAEYVISRVSVEREAGEVHARVGVDRAVRVPAAPTGEPS